MPRRVDSSTGSTQRTANAARSRCPERLDSFLEFCKKRLATVRKRGTAGRDYALFQTLYLAGVRAEDASSLDRGDIHFGHGVAFRLDSFLYRSILQLEEATRAQDGGLSYASVAPTRRRQLSADHSIRPDHSR
jgi:integrase